MKYGTKNLRSKSHNVPTIKSGKWYGHDALAKT